MNFTVYSKQDCPYCSSIIQILIGKDLSFTEYKLDDHFTKDQFYHVFGENATFPQVQFDQLGEERVHLGGCLESISFLQEKQLCCTV